MGKFGARLDKKPAHAVSQVSNRTATESAEQRANCDPKKIQCYHKMAEDVCEISENNKWKIEIIKEIVNIKLTPTEEDDDSVLTSD